MDDTRNAQFFFEDLQDGSKQESVPVMVYATLQYDDTSSQPIESSKML